MLDPTFYDRDSDGINDTAGLDTDGDGHEDTWVLDTNEDGTPDAIQFDTNGDGQADTLWVDDGNGTASVYQDLNGDGYFHDNEFVGVVSYDAYGGGTSADPHSTDLGIH